LDEFRGFEVLVGDSVAKEKNGFFFSNPKSLLMLDSCRAHVTPEIKTIVKKYSKMAVIPGCLTKKLKPPDITVNKQFKDQLRAKWENWMMGGIHEYNKTGQMKRPSYKDIVAWIVESWAALNENGVRNGLIKARGDEAVSGDST
jgi:predicted MPP superfamily phosphohydrolase